MDFTPRTLVFQQIRQVIWIASGTDRQIRRALAALHTLASDYITISVADMTLTRFAFPPQPQLPFSTQPTDTAYPGAAVLAHARAR